MEFYMTPNEALKIQADQIVYYSKFKSGLAEIVKSMTNVEGIDLDAPMNIFEINKRIPRGSEIEHLCGLSDVARKQKQEDAKAFLKLVIENNCKKDK